MDAWNGAARQARTSAVKEVSRTETMMPTAFIFQYENQLFLTFCYRMVSVWNFQGVRVTVFWDHVLGGDPECNKYNIYITSDQRLIISYCKLHDDCHADVDALSGEGLCTSLETFRVQRHWMLPMQ